MIIAAVVVAVAAYVLHYNPPRQGRLRHRGSEQSRCSCGCPWAARRSPSYTIRVLLALAGCCCRSTCSPGTACHAVGMELDAIAAVVIGGTLLTGGSGCCSRTVLGVLVLGLIQTDHQLRGHVSARGGPDLHRLLLFVFNRPCSACSPPGAPVDLRGSGRRGLSSPATCRRSATVTASAARLRARRRVASTAQGARST
ncbi:hypothetical protein [Nonomuraea dietziae]|uniref:hypothetical protein n=1 Tax=Nonomuraea dietziae TaxID=65515 RepID=UPI0031D25425